MDCPVCNVALQLADRQGVEIDYCPKCRGIWLDRGELDKLIQRSESFDASQSSAMRGGRSNPDVERPRGRDDDDYDDDRHGRRRRRSFLGDFFDFD